MKLKQKLLLFFLLFPFFTGAQFVEQQQTEEILPTGETINKVDDVINVFLAIIFIASVFGFIFSAVQYVIAGGSESSLKKARQIRTASIIGASLALAAYVIIKILQLLLG